MRWAAAALSLSLIARSLYACEPAPLEAQRFLKKAEGFTLKAEDMRMVWRTEQDRRTKEWVWRPGGWIGKRYTFTVQRSPVPVECDDPYEQLEIQFYDGTVSPTKLVRMMDYDHDDIPDYLYFHEPGVPDTYVIFGLDERLGYHGLTREEAEQRFNAGLKEYQEFKRTFQIDARINDGRSP